MKKYIVFLFICFFSLISWSKDISWYDLELRNNLYYEKNKNIPFTGEIKSKKKNLKSSPKTPLYSPEKKHGLKRPIMA